jgi:hypothetical protein
MPEEPAVETPPVEPGEDVVDLEELIGGVLEARGFTADRAAKLDILDGLGESFGSKLDEVFSKLTPGTPATPAGQSGGLDMDGLLSKIGEMVDAKFAGLTPGTPAPAVKKKPLMQRMLGVQG